MPELPEVEVVCRGLRRVVVGRTIGRVTVRAPKSSVTVSPSLGARFLDEALRGRRIESVDRRGKNILIRLAGRRTLWVHLKMTGRFLWLPRTEPIAAHDLVIVDFLPEAGADDGHHLRFNDYRRFGRWRLYPDDELDLQEGLRALGPEPSALSADDFAALCRRRPRRIKAALLDQSFLAGIGNIYADEALYAARLHPLRLTTAMSRRKLRELHTHIVRLLRRAIHLMGTSVDSYSGVNGRPGRFQSRLQVYGREGKPCGRCGAAIVRRKIGARSAHFCPRCQRAGEAAPGLPRKNPPA